MYLYADAFLFCLFVWWVSTGAIMFLDGLKRWTFKYSMLGASVMTFAALGGIARTANDTTPHGAYVAFACAVIAWGWLEISFYMGVVTGVRPDACPEGCGGWRHFGHAIMASIWHELAILAGAAWVLGSTWHAPNQVAAGTFMVLLWMHQSAKLNVFLGVRNLDEEFLPEHLAFLKSFFRRKPMNMLFPVSVTVSTVVCGWLVQRAIAPGASEFTRTGYTFMAGMMALAILEHWVLVLPLPMASLWRWSLSSRDALRPFDVRIVAGFLGAGKTTFVRRLLAETNAASGRTLVLVNDFAAVGIDGSLLSGQGADVLELPNGCICCSLKADLALQLKDAVARFAPERVIIEPSGVADLASLMGVLSAPRLKSLVRSLEVTTILDAGSFLADYSRMEAHLRAQMVPAGRVVLNKADIVSTLMLRMIAETAASAAPRAEIVAARFGDIDESIIQRFTPATTLKRLVSVPAAGGKVFDLTAHIHHAGENHGRDHRPGVSSHAGEPHEHDLPHERLGLTSWSAPMPANCNAEGLASLLQLVLDGLFGQVERVKGVARAGAGWVRFDVAGGRTSMAAFAAGKDEAGRVVAIGRHVDEERLRAAFEACAIEEAAA